jgi:hypothetical protein
MQVMSTPRPLYLPRRPLTWAMDRIDTALHDMRAASASGWRSALADRYRDEIEDLTRDVNLARTAVLDAERAYEHLRYTADINGER